MPTTRLLPLIATMPNDGNLTVDTEGLVSGHGCLRTGLAQILTELDAERILRPVPTLTGRNRGAAPLDVDELFEGCDEYH